MKRKMNKKILTVFIITLMITIVFANIEITKSADIELNQNQTKDVPFNLIPLGALSLSDPLYFGALSHPAPPSGSDYDQTTLDYGIDIPLLIAGGINGDPSMEHYVSQSIKNARTPTTGFGGVFGYTGDVTHPLLIGISSIQMNPNTDPEQWLYYIIINSSDIEPNNWYCIFATFPDNPIDIDPGKTFYMIVSTDEDYTEEEEKYWVWGGNSTAPYARGIVKIFNGETWFPPAFEISQAFFTFTEINYPPNVPSTPSGPSSGYIEIPYTYSTIATDPDGDQVQYRFDWGDGTKSSWTPLVDSGESASMSKLWNNFGTYKVKAQARDEPGAESEWSNSFEVNVVKASEFTSPGNAPRGLTWDGEYLWNADQKHQNQKIYKINPLNGGIIDSFRSPGDAPRGLTWDGEHLWNADSSTNKIYKINPSDGSIVPGYSFNSTGALPQGLAWDGEYLWNADSSTNKIYKINPSDGKIKESYDIQPGNDPTGLTFGNGYLWIADSGKNKIYMVNPSNGRTEGCIDTTGTEPQGLAWDGEYLWNADSRYNMIYKVSIADINRPPNKPKISGPNEIKPNTEYSYTISATDPDNDKIYYYIDWDDETNTGWLGSYNSGYELKKSHSWEEKKDFVIRAKARDTNGLESGWSSLSISVAKNKDRAETILTRIFNRLPFFEKLFDNIFSNIIINQYLLIIQANINILRGENKSEI